MKYKYIMHLFLCTALIFIGAAQELNAKGAYFISDDITVGKNATFNIPLQLICDNAMPVAFQFELALPSGVELNMDINDTEQITAILNRERLDGHMFAISSRGNGKYRFLLFSVGNKKLKGEEGVIITLPLRTVSTITTGTKQLKFESVLISDQMEQPITLPSTNGIITVINMVEVPKEASFALSNVRSERGKNFNISLAMTNTTEVAAFQFDLVLPKDINLNTDLNSASFDNLFNSSRRNEHSLTISSLGENKYRFVAFSINNNSFRGENGNVLSIPLTVPDKTFDGIYPVKIENAFISDLQGKDLTQSVTDGQVEVYTGSTPMQGAYLEIPNTNAVVNQTATIAVGMYNYSPATAFQCDILLPTGVTPVLPDELNTLFDKERVSDHVITISGIGTNKFRILAISMSNSSFKGTAGNILEIPVKILSSCQPGEYELKLESALISDSNNKDITLESRNGTIFVQEKIDIDMSHVILKDSTVTYNGNPHDLLILGTLPEGITKVVYTGNGVVDAGSYNITASFEVAAAYNKPADMKATLTVDPAKVQGLYFADGTFTYNSQPHSLFITGDLPETVTVQYAGNGQTNAGVYQVTASFSAGKNYVAPEDKIATMTINKANIDMSNILFEDKTVVYTGNPHRISVSGELPEGITEVTYSEENYINAGNYEITASFQVDANHNKPEDMKANLIIAQAEVGEINFTDGKATYNGEVHSLTVASLPDGVSVTYVGNEQINAGVYTVTAKFTTDENHKTPEDKTAILTILKAQIDMSTVSFNNKTVTYDGTTHSLSIEGELPNGITQVVYSQNQYRNIGQYEVTTSFEVDNNHHKPNDLKAILSIMPKDIGDIALPDGTFTYDGLPHSLQILNDLPEGVSVQYEGNGQVDAGIYTVTAKFTSDGNHIAPNDMTATLTINKANIDISNIKFENKTVVYDGLIHSLQMAGVMPEGVTTVSYSGENFINAGKYNIIAFFEVDKNHNKPQDLSATLTITPAKYENLTLPGDTLVYDGKTHSLQLTNTLPEGITVSYENNDKVNIGIYTVIAKLVSNGNYIVPDKLEAYLVILKANVDLSNISFEDKEVEYNGDIHSLSLTMNDLPTGIDEVVYSENEYIAVGTYQITASFVVNSNYNKPADMIAKLTIIPAEVKGISFKDSTIAYDGKAHSIFINGELPNGVLVEYEGNGQTSAGTYTVTAKFTTNRNYITPDNMTAQLTITKANVKIEETPVASSIVTNEALKTSILSGGKASVSGVFKWKDGDIIVEKSGEYEVLFVPDDQVNYDNVILSVMVKVSIKEVYHKILVVPTENGEVRIRNKSANDMYQEGETIELEAIANDGYILDTFLANGKPIKSPYMVVEEAEISAAFKVDATNINKETTNTLVYGKKSVLVIETDLQSEATVYDATGQLIYQDIISEDTEIALSSGVYIVKLSGVSYKILVE